VDHGTDETLHSIIELLESSQKKIIMFHRNGDPDAVGSAIALSLSFPEVTLSSTGGLSAVTKNILSYLEIEIPEHTPEDLKSYDLAFILDTSTPSLLEFIPDLPKVIIDHHALNSGWMGEQDVVHYFTDPGKRSCAEIIFSMLKGAGKEIPQVARTALLAGILTDSGHLTFSTPETLRTMAEILELSDTSLEEIHNSLNRQQENFSKKMAKLRAAQRLRMEEFQGVIITTSEVNAFEGDAARAILIIGADVAMIGSSRKDEYRISARCSPAIQKRGIHLGNLLENVGKGVNGQGGGHPGAAGLSGTGDVEAILHICKERLKVMLRDTVKKEQ